MMPKQLPSVIEDKGYQNEALGFAKAMMEGKGVLRPCRDFYHLQEWMEEALVKAYLYGAQSAIRIGYRLAEEDYKETIAYYKMQLSGQQAGKEAAP